MKEGMPVPFANQPQEAPSPEGGKGAVLAATLRLGAANFVNTGLKGYTLGMEIASAMRGRRRFSDIQWNPQDEDVRGKMPRLDRFLDESRTALFESLDLRRSIRQKALSEPHPPKDSQRQ